MYASPVSKGGIVVAKRFNTLGFDGYYKIDIYVGTIVGDGVNIWLDFGKQFIRGVVLECFDLANGLKSQIFCSYAA